ncbi:MAG: glycosyltransferase family 2 protein [Deltaproteobacteria bacterium]|nr:glycosyltransferase family 2 protein [Deltaproteobacteria bacterium]
MSDRKPISCYIDLSNFSKEEFLVTILSLNPITSYFQEITISAASEDLANAKSITSKYFKPKSNTLRFDCLRKFVDRSGNLFHIGRFKKQDDLPEMVTVLGEFPAVTAACMLTKKSLFKQLGGFDQSYPTVFSDLDYCLKLKESGYRILMQPAAKLYHFEGISMVESVSSWHRAAKKFNKRWGYLIRANSMQAERSDL